MGQMLIMLATEARTEKTVRACLFGIWYAIQKCSTVVNCLSRQSNFSEKPLRSAAAAEIATKMKKKQQEVIDRILNLLTELVDDEPANPQAKTPPMEMLTIKECTEAVRGISEHAV